MPFGGTVFERCPGRWGDFAYGGRPFSMCGGSRNGAPPSRKGQTPMRTQTLANYIGEEGILRPREGKMTPAQKDER